MIEAVDQPEHRGDDWACHTRLYRAFITSAPARLDAPSTVTLYASTLSDVADVRRQ